MDPSSVVHFQTAANSKRGATPVRYYSDLVGTTERWLVHGEADSMNQLKQIRKDLPRSFENLLPADQKQGKVSREWMSRLEHVLSAQTVRSRGRTLYTQGMNFLAGMCLVLVREEELAFWLYCKILEDTLDADFFSVYPVAMIGYNAMQTVVKRIARRPEHCPKLLQALGDEFDDIIDMLMVHWLFSVFVNCIPGRLLLVLWRRLLVPGGDELPDCVRGTVALVAFALAGLRHCGEERALEGAASVEVFQQILRGVQTIPEAEDEAFLEHVARAGRLLSQNVALSDEFAAEKQRLADPLLSMSKLNPGSDMKELRDLAQTTHFSRDELVSLHSEFKTNCEAGCSLDTFKSMVGRIAKNFPVDTCCEQLFRALDRFGSGQLSFTELMVGTSILLRGGVDEKVRMAFNIFDSQQSGHLNLSDIISLCGVLFRLSMSRKTEEPESEAESTPRAAPPALKRSATLPPKKKRPSSRERSSRSKSVDINSTARGRVNPLRRCPSEETFDRLNAACQAAEATQAPRKQTRDELKDELMSRPRLPFRRSRSTIAGERSRENLVPISRDWMFAGSEPGVRSLLLKLLLVAEALPGGARFIPYEGFRCALLTEPQILLLFSWCLPEPPHEEAPSIANILVDPPSREAKLCAKVCGRCATTLNEVSESVRGHCTIL